MPYDIKIDGPEDWDQKLTQNNLGIVIDPVVFRLGQFFLEGKSEARVDWATIESDIASLASFFDLIVLHDQLPAFNYPDTYDRHLDYVDRLGAVLNTAGDKTLVHVDVEHYMYRIAKEAAIAQLQKRLSEGPFPPEPTVDEILSTLKGIQYEWEPSLEVLESQLPADPDHIRLTRFLLGQLVFAGYAQQTGAPHILAPKRSLMMTAVGLHTTSKGKISEAAIYEELDRRFRDAGDGWRNDELPWTPSFLPYLLSKMNHYREGPDVLLQLAKELRSSSAIQRYRKLREALVSENAERSMEARKELQAASEAVASALHSNRQELLLFQHLSVEVLPQAFGASAGALVGASIAGLPGAVAGSLIGIVGEQALRPVQERLWGWVVDELPFRSARKLLTRSVLAEREMQQDLAGNLRVVWETGRRSS